MSEEESDEEIDEKYLRKRPFDWEGERLTNLKDALDKKHLSNLSRYQKNAWLRYEIGLPNMSAVPRGVPKAHTLAKTAKKNIFGSSCYRGCGRKKEHFGSFYDCTDCKETQVHQAESWKKVPERKDKSLSIEEASPNDRLFNCKATPNNRQGCRGLCVQKATGGWCVASNWGHNLWW